MKKKNNQASFPDGELQCFVGTREVGKRGANKTSNGSFSASPTKRFSDVFLMRRFIRGNAARKGTNHGHGLQDEAAGADIKGSDINVKPGFSDKMQHPGAFEHRLVGQSASSMSSSSANMRTNSSSLLMSTNSSTVSGGGGYYGGVMGTGGRYASRNSSVRSGRSCVSAKSNATVLTAVSSLTGSSSICSSASAAAAYKKGKHILK